MYLLMWDNVAFGGKKKKKTKTIRPGDDGESKNQLMNQIGELLSSKKYQNSSF